MPIIDLPDESGPYATQPELEARLERTLSAGRASAVLADATGKIDAYVGGSLTQVVGAVDRLRPYGTRSLFLPGPPTTAVTAVQVDDDAAPLVSSTYALRGDTSTLELTDGTTWPPGWRGDTRWVTVTRTRGWVAGSYPARLVAITCSLAQRLLDSAPGVSRHRLGDFEEQFAVSVEDPGRLQDLTDAEKADLDLWSFHAGELYG